MQGRMNSGGGGPVKSASLAVTGTVLSRNPAVFDAQALPAGHGTQTFAVSAGCVAALPGIKLSAPLDPCKLPVTWYPEEGSGAAFRRFKGAAVQRGACPVAFVSGNEKMIYKIALAQMAECPDVQENLRKSKEYMRQAREVHGASLIVFPECYMQVLPRGSGFAAVVAGAQSLDGPFVTAMRSYAKEYGLWTVFGMRESIPGDRDHTKNLVVILDDAGEIRATYHKTHLFDGLGYTESKHVVTGEKLFRVIDTPFGRMGLFVCFELRFPEVARLQALDGADLIIVPTAWTRGKGKASQLHTLIRARALENEIFLACCDLTGEASVGESMVADPLGGVVAQAGEEEELLIAGIDTGIQEEIRKALPVTDGRRTDLYSLTEKQDSSFSDKD